jgi:protocatechuate 3,4-dioxygenase beta subunit
MKSPLALLVAFALALLAAAFFWFRLEAPTRGSSALSPAATGQEPASRREQAELAHPAATAPLPEDQKLTSPVVAAESSTAGAQREAASVEGARTVNGRITLPPGAPPDETLRVLALRENLAPRQIYGKSGVLEDWNEGKRDKVEGTAPVDAGGAFRLQVSGKETLWLAIDGRFLYSKAPEALAEDVSSLTLAAELGACLAGRVSLPSGIDDPSKVLEALEIEATPDSGDFSLGRTDLPIPRHTRPDAEGRFELRALRSESPLALNVEAEVCADGRVAGLTLKAGERREVDVALLVGASLSGVVRDQDGRGVAKAEVLAAEVGFWGFPGEELSKSESDAEGRFTLAHLRPGKVMVLAKHEGHLDSEAQKFELADREERANLVLALDQGESIAGRVRFPDGASAAGAKVEVRFDPSAMVGMGALNAARGASGEGHTDTEGRFNVTGLGKGPFVVKVELQRELEKGSELWRAKATKVAPGTEGLEVTLAAPCTLEGRVVDAEGTGVKDYRLRVHSAGAVFFDPGETREERVRDEEGHFRLTSIEAGDWEVTASAEGFGPAAPRKVTLPWSEPEPLVIALAPAASVAGTVLDPSGAPVAGASITTHVDTAQRLQRLRGSSNDPKALSGADGTFTLSGLAAGANSIVASHDEFSPSEPVPVELRTGATTSGAVLRLRKGAIVSGEVFGADGKPAGGVRVLAQSPGGLDMAMKNADVEGRFRIENLAPGSWTITALLDAREIDTEGEADDTTAAFLENMRFTMIELADGEEKHVVLGAPPKDPVLVHGRVRHGREPVASGMVNFMPEGGKGLEALKMSALDASGAFEARLDAPGRYVVSVQVTGESAFQQQTIEFREAIPEVQEHSLELALPLGGIRGRVLGSEREPLAGARVTLTTDGGIESGSMMGGQYAEAVTLEDGSYAFDYLRPGTYGVAAGGALFGGAFGNASSAGRELRSNLRVDEGRTLEGVDFELKKPGRISGRVIDAAGVPVKDVAVFVRNANGRLLDRFSMIASGADGTFQYEGVAPGEYLVSARGKNLASVESEPLRVDAGGGATTELVLQAGTKLLIEIEDDEGNPLEARLSVTDAKGHEVQGMFGWVEMSSAFASGIDTKKTSVGPLPPGSYTVTAITSDGKKTSRPVTLDGQPERRLRLRAR